MKAHIITFGCRSNQCDSRWIAQSLIDAGCEISEEHNESDVLIVNTCAVTSESERQGRQALRRLRRENPHAVVLATGCAVQGAPGKFLSMPEIDYVVDLEARGKLSEVIADLGLRVSPTLLQPPGEAAGCFFCPEPTENHLPGPIRAPLKIQDGCDNACTYCLVTVVRGPSRSMPPDEVMKHLEALARAGHREVVLTGIHLGGWGRDLDPPRNLESLLRRALMREYVSRIRLSSIDPTEVTGELLDLLASEEGLCPHLHLPLQSANDEILEAMGRSYGVHEAEVRIRLLKQAVPHAAVGLDIIVGFPRETEEHFEKSVKRLKQIPFDYLHVFPFSPRPGVPASQMDGRPNSATVQRRSRKLHKMSAKRRKAFWESSLGTMRRVIIESRTQEGQWFGHTDNYIPVLLSSGSFEVGDMVSVGLHKLEEKGVIGERVR